MREECGQKYEVDHEYQDPVSALGAQERVHFGHRNGEGCVRVTVLDVLLRTDTAMMHVLDVLLHTDRHTGMMHLGGDTRIKRVLFIHASYASQAWIPYL